MVERISKPLIRRMKSKTILPVIVKMFPNCFQKTYPRIRELDLSRVVSRRFFLQEYIPYGYYGALPLFNMASAILYRGDIEDLAEDPCIEKIYYDFPVEVKQLPVVPQEGVYSLKKIRFTTTYYTRKILGAEDANARGWTGKGVKVAVPDTGVFVYHSQLGFRWSSVEFDTVMPLQRVDSNGHGCVMPGTKILFKNPGPVKIEEFYESIGKAPVETNAGLSKILDKEVYVASVDPNSARIVWDRVIAAHRLEYDGEIYVIKTTNGYRLELTPWHPVLVAKPDYVHGWSKPKLFYKRADEVKRGDYLVVPAKPIDYGAYQKIVYYTHEQHTRRLVRREVIIDEDLAWLIGYAIGDGTITSNEVRLTDEKKDVLEHAMRIALKHGFSCGRGVIKRGKSYELYIYGLQNLMRELNVVSGDNGKQGSGKRYLRRVPEIIFKSPVSVRAAFVAGIIDSEGWFADKEHLNGKQVNIIAHVLVNASEELARGVAELLETLGIKPKIRIDKSPVKRGESPIWTVSVNQFWRIRRIYSVVGKYIVSFKKNVIKRIVEKRQTINHGVVEINDELVAFRVVDVSKKHYRGYMYDLTTERHNNYWADGFIAHNSWCCTAIGGAESEAHDLSRITGKPAKVAGIAPDTELYCIKCLGYLVGTGSSSQVAKAMELALSWGADIVSMSLGGAEEAESPEDDPYYPILDKYIEQQIIPVIAAGNEGPEPKTVSSPGALPQAVTVGAYDPIEGVVAEFSSRGPTPWGDVKPDICMPGVNILSGSTGILDVAVDKIPDHYAILSGTSMATPHAAGIIALMRQAHRDVLGKTLETSEVKRMMEAWAVEHGKEKDNSCGWGVLTWEVYAWWISTQYGERV